MINIPVPVHPPRRENIKLEDLFNFFWLMIFMNLTLSDTFLINLNYVIKNYK
jgi:hypothetical protein